MNNDYRKDRSYIKQRLEYVSPEDYILELENEIDNLKSENEELKEQKKEAIEFINSYTKGIAITELTYGLFEVKRILGGDYNE